MGFEVVGEIEVIGWVDFFGPVGFGEAGCPGVLGEVEGLGGGVFVVVDFLQVNFPFTGSVEVKVESW